jgi:DNA-binding XRE family transcriptional regulator
MPKKPPASEIDRMAGLRLRAVREAWDPNGVIRQETFAAKLGVTRTALANWEAGKLPDVRAMVRLYDWLGIPLEWIFLGQLRHVDYDLADRLAAAAAALGATVGAAAAPEWPMAVERQPGTRAMRQPGAIPVRPRRATLHERPSDTQQ